MSDKTASRLLKTCTTSSSKLLLFRVPFSGSIGICPDVIQPPDDNSLNIEYGPTGLGDLNFFDIITPYVVIGDE